MKQSVEEHKKVLADLKEFIRKEALYLEILNERFARSEIEYGMYKRQIETAESRGTESFDRDKYLVR